MNAFVELESATRISKLDGRRSAGRAESRLKLRIDALVTQDGSQHLSPQYL
jgi:hypothetical protein